MGKRDFKTTHKKAHEYLDRDIEVKSLNEKMVELKNLQKKKNLEKGRYRFAY